MPRTRRLITSPCQMVSIAVFVEEFIEIQSAGSLLTGDGDIQAEQFGGKGLVKRESSPPQRCPRGVAPGGEGKAGSI